MVKIAMSSSEGSPIVIEYRDQIAIIRFPSNVLQKKEAEYFTCQFYDLSEQDIVGLLVDLSGCEYVSSEGLGATARYWKWCKDRKLGFAVLLPGKGSEVHNLFDLIGLTQMMGDAVQTTLEGAIQFARGEKPSKT